MPIFTQRLFKKYMGKKFTEYSRFDLSEINKEVLNQWDKQDLFHQSLETREGCPSFVFYEGPPSANGMPGIHHVMAVPLKIYSAGTKP